MILTILRHRSRQSPNFPKEMNVEWFLRRLLYHRCCNVPLKHHRKVAGFLLKKPPTKRGRISIIWRNRTCMSFVQQFEALFIPSISLWSPNKETRLFGLAKNPRRVETQPPWLASKDAFNVFKVRLTTGVAMGWYFSDRFWGSGRLFGGGWGVYGKLERKHQAKTRRTLGGKGNDEYLTTIYTKWKNGLHKLSGLEEISSFRYHPAIIQL